MNLDNLISIMEKVGSISFDDDYERYGFIKVAQGLPMDPSMMQGMPPQQGGMPMPPGGMPQQPMTPDQLAYMQQVAASGGIGALQDPSSIALPQQEMAAEGQMPPQGLPGSPTTPEESVVGESISNKDIESLLKVVNILTALKTKYEGVKKEQMTQLQTPEGLIGNVAPALPPAPAPAQGPGQAPAAPPVPGV